MAGFAAQVSAFVAKSERRMIAVHRESSDRVVRIAQTPRGDGGRMPIRTGTLRASGIPSLNQPVTREGQSDVSEIALTLAQLKPGDTFYFVWTVSYARHVELGTYRMAPAGFREGAVAQWQRIVDEVARELESRSV